jgi:dolichol-phosphate mannosyltransferase
VQDEGKFTMTIKPLVMIPTYNEALSIGPLIEQVLELSQEIEILVIDDNSPDQTAEVVRKVDSARVHLLPRSAKSGLGSAYRAGFTWAQDHPNFTHYATMDGDGSHRPEDLATLIARAADVDVVLSSRWMPGGAIQNWPKYRQFISRVGTFYAHSALKLPYTDLTGGFRVYSSGLINRLKINEITSEGYCFQIEMILASDAASATFSEVPITFIERELGRSKMTKRIVIEALAKVTRWGWQIWFRHNADKLHYVK